MNEDRVAAIAARHGFGPEAARVVREALRAGRGMAQFDHPELGGRGQWMSGMIMIGAMSDHALKARVAALCADLAEIGDEPTPRGAGSPPGAAGETFDAMETWKPMEPLKPMRPMAPLERWWPEDLGEPESAGSQDGMSYAYFARPGRLAVRRDGETTLYDTGGRAVTGVAQRQSRESRDLTFTGPDGDVPLASLNQVG